MFVASRRINIGIILSLLFRINHQILIQQNKFIRNSENLGDNKQTQRFASAQMTTLPVTISVLIFRHFLSDAFKCNKYYNVFDYRTGCHQF